MKIVFVVRQLPDAVVDSNTALAGCHVLLRHLYPAQGTHCKTLTVQICSTISTKQDCTGKVKINEVKKGWKLEVR